MRALLFLPLLLISCGDFLDVPTIRPKIKKSTQGEGAPAGGFAGLGYEQPPEGDAIAAGDAPVEAAGYLPTSVKAGEVKIQGYVLPGDDSIAWSDEEKPMADIKLDEAFTEVKKPKGAWLTSYPEARRLSARTGKPLFIWFTRTKGSGSPICKTLKREVFDLTDFRSWSLKNVVRLKIDLSGAGGPRGEFGEIMDAESRERDYLEGFKKKYRVLGLPAVILESPALGVLGQYRGYKKGTSAEYFGQLKNTVLTHEHNYAVKKRELAAKGYRTWTGKNDQAIFAKLIRYSAGDLLLVEPNGKKVKTKESQLSKKDRQWIDAAKARRK
ncbi:thioredoxin family protein [Akkermansiaceae bacterium]|nr:thioredoxin family protein [Akkermansiaceae bacterium]MDB4568245.1 thioredoxin family protein [Akkermansiaceae bacterium]